MSLNGLEITEVNVVPVKSSENQVHVANARMVLNGLFVIAGIKIIKGKFGLFISFPRDYNKKEQKGYNHAFPISKELHEHISEKILAEYNLIQNNQEEV